MTHLRSILFHAAAAVPLMLAATGCSQSRYTTSPGEYRTITVDPTRDTDAARRHNDAGFKRFEAGDIDAAEDLFRKALTADVEFAPAHMNLGRVYYRRKDWYHAAWEFEYARKLLPNHGGPHNNLGLVWQQDGQMEKAVTEFRKAVALDRDNMEYVGNLAAALLRRGDRTEETRALLEQMVKNDRRSEWLIWAQQQLAGMRPQ
jgi:Flp pilus assembly protein TadD